MSAAQTAPDCRRVVLVTRPEAQARETAQRLAALGWTPLPASALAIVGRTLRMPARARPQALLLTSGNAVAALPAALHAVPLLAVGDATATRARAAGFVQVASAGRDAVALARLAVQRCAPGAGALWVVCGEGQGAGLAATLRAAGFRVVRRVAYASRPLPGLAAAPRTALARRQVVAALFFSPASAAAFTAAVRREGLTQTLRQVVAVAISPAAAAPLALLQWQDIRVASHPNQDELLACLT